jgi:hypothetical protein
MTESSNPRDRVAARLAWLRDQLVLHKRIIEDLQSEADEGWYALGELDGSGR